MMATLRSFMVSLLRQTMEGARSAKNAAQIPPAASRVPERPKTKPGRRDRARFTPPVAVQYSQESPKNNALFAPWLADFSENQRRLSRYLRPRPDRPRA